MIPVHPQPEPLTFDSIVRSPGRRFLRRNPNPTNRDWKKAPYWQKSLPDLYNAYGGICAYCAEWIPPNTGEASVDHFVPKSIQPNMAYEWSNFRLAARRFNALKENSTDLIDPITLSPDWFILDIPSLQIKPNSNISNADATRVTRTITALRLNDERSINSRERWIRDYCRKLFNFDYLMQNAPFIAYELERQGLKDQIINIVNGR